MTLRDYIENINRKYKVGNTTEHTFRGNLEQLIESIVPDVMATNEPSGQKCGKPDYVLMRKDIPLGYIEAKDLNAQDLDGKKQNKKQFDRYKAALNNIIFTDYLTFQFYRDGEKVGESISIGKIENGSVLALSQHFEQFEARIKDFCANARQQTIRSSKKLSSMMAGKARLLSNVIELALNSDETHNEDSTLKAQMIAFKDILIHDITAEGFADIYAQTITYGLFAARLHDPTLPTFSRQEAAELIPKSNPFLRKLFGYIAGPDIDDRILWIVNDLVEIFLACDVAQLLKDYGKTTGMEDPIIHFYENFLSEYDPALRKARGVWYTPKPVVNFIVRAVDEILKTDFNLPKGLADTSKTTIKKAIFTKATADSRSKSKTVMVEEEVHKVQILDPATGTGTFLAEVVKHINLKFKGQAGLWSTYVTNHLIPRLNGFELLMASYAMAHLQMDLLLTETGYTTQRDERLRIYLTNSLEEHHPETGTLFANWLSAEANDANRIKRDTPVMCVIGNPPYSVSSSNKSDWIESLTADYKKDLKERNIQPLSDDYIKFIRFGQHFIDKNGEGILAYISNNSFIDGLIHRQMRKHLLESFDSIYVLDLHGNAKKKEVALDGSTDQNVFDIMQGVSINVFVKTGKKKDGELAQVKHFDLQGKRNFKYDFLTENSLKSIVWNELKPNEPNYFLVKKDFDESGMYENGFKVDVLFGINASGIKTERDSLTIQENDKLLSEIENAIIELDIEQFRKQYTPKPDGRDWKIVTAKEDLRKNIKVKSNILYRPFDIKKTIYTGKSKGFHSYPRAEVMKHLLQDNFALIFERSVTIGNFTNIFISKCLVECHVLGTAFSFGYTAPLYLYPDQTGQLSIGEKAVRTPNLNVEIIQQMTNRLGLAFTNEKEKNASSFAPIDVLDYIYAVLHSPTYREKYKEFLKIDFPRVPYPKDVETFWQLVKLGGEIRQIHLLESDIVEDYITEYPIVGSDVVDKPKYDNEKVYINESQYFDKVPQVAWEFYIGGYQPAQKWLKDRKGITLSFDDILHYQKIIVALSETARLMQEIDLIGVE